MDSKEHFNLATDMSKYKSILLVEDDRDDQEFFVEVIKEVAPTVAWAIADNGEAAFAAMQKLLPETPDLILLDLNMPIMNGHQFMRHMQEDEANEIYRHIPIVILTTSSAGHEEAYKLGASLFISKPASFNLYKIILSTLLAHDVAAEKEALRPMFAALRENAGGSVSF